jgi:hypothetical protein
MQTTSLVKPLATAIAFSLLSVPALAGKAMVETADGDRMMMEYDPYGSGNVRMGMPGDQQGYMLVNDGILYLVSYDGGKPVVMYAAVMMKRLGATMAKMTPGAAEELVSIEATGRNERVAGIDGEVYVATTRTNDGKETTRELVLSDDERAVALMQGMLNFTDAGMEAVDEAAFEEEQSQTLQRFLDMEQLGLLRAGDDFAVTALSAEQVPESRFALPGEPRDLPGMGSWAP